MRRGFLAIGIIVMSFNSLYQYSWNVFEPLLKTGFNVSIVYIQVAFTIFAIFSTGFQGIGGYFADKNGPRNIGIISAILSAVGFIGTSLINNIFLFYLLWSLGSIGEGILYGISTNLAVKWFKGKRGFAVGFVSLGFGMGAAVANIFIAKAVTFRTPMLIIGIAEIVILPLLMSIAKYPESKELSGEKTSKNLRNKKFWILYVSFILGGVPLLVISASFGYIGKNLPLYEFTLLVSLFPLLSGISRPILGYISDYIGRIKSVFIIDIFLTAGSIFLILKIYAISIILIGFFGGSMISMYFSLVGDIFGSRFSTANNGVFYTGKAISGFIGSTLFAAIFILYRDKSFYFVLISSLFAILFLILSMRKENKGYRSGQQQEVK
ncbi:OFA family MFS transporter [Acidiplasma sp.]|uniref:OFA family MFS transporter n=1 Tax=Acidiplasma sp. TaxID=1872114 RepID=UPI00258CB48A|nr:OFA family MFS transporter [Acidiplasma sp.]